MDDLFNEKNIPESNWFKFEKVGDAVGGTLVEITDKEAKDIFPAQRVFTLKQANGDFVKVGIDLRKDYVIGRANSAKLGDELGFKFMKEVPASTKGFAPAKSIEVFVRHAASQTEEKDPFAV